MNREFCVVWAAGRGKEPKADWNVHPTTENVPAAQLHDVLAKLDAKGWQIVGTGDFGYGPLTQILMVKPK